MKKGFTLIELLAVIIILAILMIVAVPNVLGTLNDAKRSTFITQAKSLWTTAEQQYVLKQMNGVTVVKFSSLAEDASKGIYKLDLATISPSVKYCITLDGTGKVSNLLVNDGSFKTSGTGVTTINGLDGTGAVVTTTPADEAYTGFTCTVA